MNQDEAKTLLESYRPNGQDANDPRFAQALGMIQSDPGLANWFEKAQQLDVAIAQKLRDIPVPPNLRARLLEHLPPSKIIRLASWWRRPVWQAAAAVFVISLISLAFWSGHRPNNSGSPPLPREAVLFRRDMAQLLSKIEGLDVYAPNLGQIHRYLARFGPRSDFRLPLGMRGLTPIGCRILSWHGNKVSLICFRSGKRRQLHLLVIDQDALPPLQPGVRYERSGLWATALWSSESKDYLLLGRDGNTELRHCLH